MPHRSAGAATPFEPSGVTCDDPRREQKSRDDAADSSLGGLSLGLPNGVAAAGGGQRQPRRP